MGKKNLKKKPESAQAAALHKKMKEVRKNFLRISSQSYKIRPLDDQDAARVDRSTDVTVEFFDFIQERYGNEYPKDLKGTGALEDWAMLNVMPAASLDELASRAMLLEGATIHILDILEETGRMDALREMEDAFDWDGEWEPFTFHDSVHDQMDLAYVFNVLRQRNEDCAGFDWKDREEGSVRWLRDSVTLYDRQFQDVPSRNRFESLLSLIPQDILDQRLESLEDRFLAMYDIFMEDRLRDFKKLAQMEWTRRHRKQLLEQERKKNFENVVEAIGDEDLAAVLKELGEQSDFSDPQDNEEERFSEFMKDIFAKAAQFGPMFTYSDEALSGMVDDDIRDKMREYDIGDLFGHCLSVLYICDRGLPFAWMQYPLSMFVHAVSWQLPWNYIPEAGKTEGGPAMDTNPFKPCQCVAEHGERMYSLAQILYTLGEVIAPRNYGEFAYYASFIGNMPVSQGEKDWISLAGGTLFRAHCLIKQADDSLVDEEDDDAKTEQVARLAQENRRLGRLLKECQEHLHEMQDAQKKQEKKHADELVAARYEHDELARLREALYASRSNDAMEDEDENLHLPLRLKHKIVCFGGHDSWFRAIRPMLDGDVRFIDTNKSTNTNLVKFADIVYLQTNALNHSVYHKILNIASKYQKPVFYMPSASAKKCAEHMYLADKSLD